MRASLVFIILLAFCAQTAKAQAGADRFQIGAQLASVASGEFDSTDVGVGVRFSWHPISLLGAEAELDLYPRDFPRSPAFSRSRVEALFGITAGPRIGRVRPFAKLRPGFIAFREAPGPIACIAIFPPPLSCTLAAGATVFALDVGGGLEYFPATRLFLRIDLGDRLVKYPGPALDASFKAQSSAFFGHDFRLGLGAGVRF
jgi:hypothetical protein